MAKQICRFCDGSGSVDSGGSEPWGAAIWIKCGHCDGTGRYTAAQPEAAPAQVDKPCPDCEKSTEGDEDEHLFCLDRDQVVARQNRAEPTPSSSAPAHQVAAEPNLNRPPEGNMAVGWLTQPTPSSAPQIPADETPFTVQTDDFRVTEKSDPSELRKALRYMIRARYEESLTLLTTEAKLHDAEAALAAERLKAESYEAAFNFDAPHDQALRDAMAPVVSALGGSLKGEAAKEILRLRERTQQAENKGWNDAIEAASRAVSSMTYNGDYYTTYTDHFDSGVRVAEKVIRALSRTEPEAQPKEGE